MIEALKGLALFRDLDPESLSALATRMEERTLEAGEVLFREGDVGDTVFVVGDGALQVRKDEKTLAVLHAGRTLGEMAFFEEERRSADAVALEPTTLYAIRNENCRAYLREHPEPGARILFGMLREMSRRLRETSAYLTTVYETGQLVGSGLPVEAMSERILDRLLRDMEEARGGTLLLYNPYGEAYEAAASVGVLELDDDHLVRLVDEHPEEDVFQDDAAGSVLGAALRHEDGATLGYLVLTKADGEPFTSRQEVVLAAVARQTGLGILRAWARQEDADRERLAQHRMEGRPGL